MVPGTKKPPPACWPYEGWRVDAANLLGVDAPGNYEKLIRSQHGLDVNGIRPTASNLRDDFPEYWARAGEAHVTTLPTLHILREMSPTAAKPPHQDG